MFHLCTVSLNDVYPNLISTRLGAQQRDPLTWTLYRKLLDTMTTWTVTS